MSLASEPAAPLRSAQGGEGAAPARSTSRRRAAAPPGGASPGGARRTTGDLVVATVVALLALVVLAPLAPWVIDLLIAGSLAGSVVVLVAAMYTTDPLEFSVFPTLLLLGAVVRLAINVALARLILLDGAAGALAGAFGAVVMAGNPVVGFVMFLILMIVQFVVISTGASRMAEVAARFTLDAMPGKQMAIDADLNAGLLTEEAARERRRAIERQADFYGAMDGAGKFVRGDAAAGAVILLIDLVGGVALGVLSRGQALPEALRQTALLTVGAGLAVQIPAFLIGTASGILVSRAAAREPLGAEVPSQLAMHPQAVTVSALVLGAVGLVPGMPKLVFLPLALVLALAARARARRPAPHPPGPAAVDPGSREALEALLVTEPLEVLVGSRLLGLATCGDLKDRLTLARRQVTQQLGILVPPIRLRDSLTLPPSSYALCVWGTEVARGTLHPDRLMAIPTGRARGDLPGIREADPTFGGPVVWIEPGTQAEAEQAGYFVVPPTAVVATHVVETLRRHAPELLTRQAVREMVERLRPAHGALLEELIPKVATLGLIQRVLCGLVEEGVSVKPLVRILEALSDALAGGTREPQALVEAVRRSLGAPLWQPYLAPDRTLPVIVIDPALQDRLQRAQEEGRPLLGLGLRELGLLVDRVAQARAQAAATGTSPVLVCAGALRVPLRKVLGAKMPTLAVLAYEELRGDVHLKTVGTVTLG